MKGSSITTRRTYASVSKGAEKDLAKGTIPGLAQGPLQGLAKGPLLRTKQREPSSSKVESESQKKPSNRIYHCAYCLTYLDKNKVPIIECLKCKRRVYCSETCRRNDSYPTIPGQKHYIWCALNCGEEGVDWKVDKVEGKGQGIVAIRKLEANYRVMVDWSRPLRNSLKGLIHQLVPEGGTMQEKLSCNNFRLDQNTFALFMKVSRFNHSCDPNACYYYDSENKCMVIVTKREIQENEEITLQYLQFNEMRRTRNPKEYRSYLQHKWEIKCPRDCRCRKTDLEDAYKEAKLLHKEIETEYNKETNANPYPQIVTKIDDWLKLSRQLDSPVHDIKEILFWGFVIAVMGRSTTYNANLFITQLIEKFQHIYPPSSYDLNLWIQYKDNPEVTNFWCAREGRYETYLSD